MSFRIGQRVRAIASLNPRNTKYLGAVGVIVSSTCDMDAMGHTTQLVRWQEGAGPYTGETLPEPVKCLAPIDDDADFKRFMERVLKPVDLGQPVSA